MRYYKKSCILRQLKAGFSGDGKPLTGLIKAEKYGRNLAVEISIINFAPLSSGEYYCLLSDAKGRVERLPLRGKCYFNLLSDLSLEEGFCGVICFVHTDFIPIAYGINGDRQYDFPKILATAFSDEKREKKSVHDPEKAKNTPPREEFIDKTPEIAADLLTGEDYDDEKVASENYYEKERENEPRMPEQSDENVPPESGDRQETEDARADTEKNDDDEDVCHPFAVDGRGYYDAVQDEIRTLFDTHPRDDTLKGAFSCSEWVRVKGEEGNPVYLVGVVYEEFLPKYICYAIAAQDENSPPKELGEACVFVPTTPFEENKGFFVIFQSAATGECILPKRC